MATNKIIVEERSRDIGKFLVGRLLPFREKRMVGPFCFIDHMGPLILESGDAFDVDQHPHIGLCTLTYLLDGEIEHCDSTGARQIITPGSVNLMVSGKGVSHTERTPKNQRGKGILSLHGYQVWIALPKEKEEMEPAFYHLGKEELPNWSQGNHYFTLVAGQAFGKTASTPCFSPLFIVDIRSDESGEIDLRGQVEGEIAFVVVSGSVRDGQNEIKQGQMLISKTENECSIFLEAKSRLLVFGGMPLPEERFMFWNFVSSRKARLDQAKLDWKNHRFPSIPNDGTYIPLPD